MATSRVLRRLSDRLSVIHRRARWGAFVRAGDEANAAHDWRAAEIAYAKALKRNPQLAHIWVQYGHALKEQGRLQEAEDAYRRSLDLDGGVADTHLQLGHVLKLQARATEAIRAYRTAYAVDPDCASVHELRAMGIDPDESTVDPDFVNQLYGLGLKRTRIKLSDDEVYALLNSKAPGEPVYLSPQMLLDEHQLSYRVIDLFDHNYYFYANGIADGEWKSPSFAKCLLHFCQTGVYELKPFNPEYIFDYRFYVKNFLAGKRVTPDAAYRHWLRCGLDHGWAPNKRMWLRQELGTPTGADLDDLLGFFEAKLPDWSTLDVHRFLNRITTRNLPNTPETPEAARTLVQIADYLAMHGKEDAASALYDRVLDRFPELWQALQHQADLLFRKHSYSSARVLYEKIRSQGQASIWTYINLADSAKMMGGYSSALTVLGEGVNAFREDVGIRARYRHLTDDFFKKEWDLAYSEARAGQLRDAQKRVATACRAVTPSSNCNRPEPRPIKSVAILGNGDLPQCRLYRIEQKIEQLTSAGYSVTSFDYKTQTEDFILEVYKFEAVIFYRVPAFPAIIRAIATANELGLSTFYEIDDLIFDPAEYPTSFESYGGQISRDEYIGLCLGVPLFAHSMSMCLYGIASTNVLAREMSKYVVSGVAKSHSNGFSIKHEAYGGVRPRTEGEGSVTIFYGSGTKAHKEDFEELVVPALVEMVRRYGSRISIVIVGYISISERLKSISDNVTLLDPIWNVDDYWQILSQADLNLSVLKPSLMADCKSEIKWLEAAMFAVPSVVSRTVTHVEVIEEGVTGFLCATPADWVEAIDRLVCNPDLRRDVGLAAQRKVSGSYSLRSLAANLRSIFRVCNEATDKPRIVVVNVFYPPQTIGGATRVVYDNVKEFVANYADDFTVEVFTSIQASGGGYETNSYVQNGVRVTGVITPHIPDIDKQPKDPRMGEIFGKYLDAISPVLVHFHCIQRLTASVVGAAQRRALPYLITVHDGWWISDNQFIVDEEGNHHLYRYDRPREMIKSPHLNTFIRMRALRAALFGAERIIAVSEAFASIYRACGVANVMTISNGVTAILQRNRLRSPDGRVRLAFIGGMAVHKGYPLLRNVFLSEAFAHLTLTVVDHSQSRGHFRRELWGTTPVEFIGPVPQQDITNLYRQIDVLLAPSIWPESYGLVTREALASGCWVVASDRGAIGEDISERENGYVIDVSDISGLVEVLKRIDRDHLRYLDPPAAVPTLRTSAEQSEALARLYGEILARGEPSTAEMRYRGASITEPYADPTAFCSRSSPTVSGSTGTTIQETMSARQESLSAQLKLAEAQIAGLRETLRFEQHRIEAALFAVEGLTHLRDEFLQARSTAEYQAVFDNHKPLVSVCVTTMNRAELLLERALASLAAQTYRNLQIIVVGDHCTDDTAERIARLGDNRISFHNFAQRGPYPRPGIDRWRVAGTYPGNRALELVEGDFVTHLDEDDSFEPQRIEMLLQRIREVRADLIFHPFYWQQLDGSWVEWGNGNFEHGQTGTSMILYHRYLARIPWDVFAYRFGEPEDWNRFRKFKLMRVRTEFLPVPLTRYYRLPPRPPFAAETGEEFLE